MRLRSLLAAALIMFCVNAHADSVTFTLLNPVQSSEAGETLLFYASVSAPSTNLETEDLNSLGFNINPANSFQIDESGFLNDFPLSLIAGQSYSGLLFSLTVPNNAALGAYTGSVDLSGGPSNGTLGSEAFTVNVTPAVTAATPEPSSFVLLGTSTGLMAAWMRRRRKDSVAAEHTEA